MVTNPSVPQPARGPAVGTRFAGYNFRRRRWNWDGRLSEGLRRGAGGRHAKVPPCGGSGGPGRTWSTLFLRAGCLVDLSTGAAPGVPPPLLLRLIGRLRAHRPTARARPRGSRRLGLPPTRGKSELSDNLRIFCIPPRFTPAGRGLAGPYTSSARKKGVRGGFGWPRPCQGYLRASERV